MKFEYSLMRVGGVCFIFLVIVTAVVGPLSTLSGESYGEVTFACFGSMRTLSDVVALGYGDGRYILFGNGTVVKVTSEGGFLRAGIVPEDVLRGAEHAGSVVFFEVLKDKLLIIDTYEFSMKSGHGNLTVTMANLKTGEVLKILFLNFTVSKRENKIFGNLPLDVIGSLRGLGILVTNSTGSWIYFYDIHSNTVKVIKNNIAVILYRFGDTIIAPVLVKTKMGGKNVQMPVLMDISTNKTLTVFLGALPIVSLTRAVLQPFHFKDTWVAFATVTEPESVRYYEVFGNSPKIIEYEPVSVPPSMDYAAVRMSNGTKIMFRNGLNLTILGKKLAPLPRGAYMPVDRTTGILDTSSKLAPAALIKYMVDKTTYVLYVNSSGTYIVCSFPSNVSYVALGFQAALNNKYAIIKIPKSSTAIIIDLRKAPNLENNTETPLTSYYITSTTTTPKTPSISSTNIKSKQGSLPIFFVIPLATVCAIAIAYVVWVRKPAR